MAQQQVLPHWRLLVFVLASTGTIALGRFLALLSHGGTPTLWPASGLFFGFLLVSPRSEWLKLISLALCSWLLGHLLSGMPLFPSLLPYWILKALAIVMGAQLLLWLTGLCGAHRDLRTLAFVGVGGLLTPLLGACFGVPILLQQGEAPLLELRHQFAANSLGILVVAPLVVSLFTYLDSEWKTLLAKDLMSDGLLLVLSFVATILVFVSDVLPDEFRFPFVIFPFCMAVSMQGKPGLTATSNAFVSLAAIYQTILGNEGFGLMEVRDLDALAVVQLFVGSITLTQLILTGIVSERKEAILSLDKRTAELEYLNHQLEQAREQAALASDAKSRFLANMSHEIRSPLGAMIGFSDLIITGHLPQAEVMKYVEIIRRNGRHLGQLIDQVLDLSKVESGRFEVESKPVVIHELIEGSAHLMAVKAKEKGLSIEVSIAPETPRMGLTDALRLRQILINALGNAIKFTHRGKIVLRARAELSPQRTWVLVCEIEDSGIGLSPEEQSRLFRAFSQADASIARNYGGTGLGLTLSRHLARALGGDYVLLHSEKGVGSVFRLHIACGPVEDRVSLGELRAQVPKAPFGIDLSLQGYRILLADDAPDTRLLLSSVLKFSGAHVVAVSDGRQAVEAALADRFDLLLMDVEMPEMDGIQAVIKLRSLNYQGPVLALTGRGMREEIEECLAAGFDSHLIKPVEREGLLEAVLNYAAGEKPFDYPDSLELGMPLSGPLLGAAKGPSHRSWS